jgi:ornithine cyclodeaminase/alanine dehydrogenase-like protein (mu-crystallin family)
MALLDAGWQAGGQPMAHCAVRPLKSKVFSPNPVNREKFGELQSRVKARLVIVESVMRSRDADIVVTATNSMGRCTERGCVLASYSAVKVQEVIAFLAIDLALFLKNPRPPGRSS